MSYNFAVTMPKLDWLTRPEDEKIASNVPYRLLEVVPELSYGDEQTENMLIQGDNLEALKALLPFYAGRVKFIYIDPPYNSKSAQFKHYDDNLEHSQWLGMMYPRLNVLRELLSAQGVIFVSIDDQEGHYLKVLMDEVFGRNNFVATFIWQKVDSPNDNKPAITPDHEFILCYEKNKGQAGLRKLGDDSVLDAYPNTAPDGRKYRDRLVKKNGKDSLRADRETMWFPIEAPDGSEVWPIHDDGREARWALSKNGVAVAKKQGILTWKQRERNGDIVWVPYKREFAPLAPARPHPTILLDVKTSRQAKAHQMELVPDALQFDTVKPEQLVLRLLQMATKKGDIVLDSYAGTGTTASVAHKKGCTWITVEIHDQILSHCLPRMKAVVDGEQGGISEAVGWSGGGGFRFYKLGSQIFDEQGHINPAIRFDHLGAHIWFSETRTPIHLKRKRSPLLGVHEGTAYYLLFNGILGDRRPEGGNVLTRRLLSELPEHDGPRVVYGESCRLSPATLQQLGIVFKQTPYDVKAR